MIKVRETTSLDTPKNLAQAVIESRVLILLPSSSNISTLHDPFLGLYILFKGLINKLPSSKTSIQEGIFHLFWPLINQK